MNQMIHNHTAQAVEEQAAREKVFSDIAACANSKGKPIATAMLMRAYEYLGFERIEIESENGSEVQVGAQFRKDWSDGVSVSEMGEKFGVNKSTISNWAKKAGLPNRIGGRTHVVKVNDAFRRAWDAGISNKKIAAALGASETAVLNAARKAGLNRRPIGNPHFRRRIEE